MSIVKWSKAHAAIWKQRAPVLRSGLRRPQPVFGEDTAAQEWQNDNDAKEVFAPIESYEDIQRHDSLFLFGRRGTGKTTILRMLESEIRDGKNSRYSFAQVINPRDLIGDVRIAVAGSPLAGLEEYNLLPLFRAIWKWVITFSAMFGLSHKNDEFKKEFSRWLLTHAEIAEEFPTDPAIISSIATNLVNRALNDALAECTDFSRVAITIAKVSENLATTRFERLKDKAIELMATLPSPGLTLIDTDETYHIRDAITRAIQTSLMEVVLHNHDSTAERYLFVKAAFPSEMIPHMRYPNRDKVEPKCVYIIWRYKDLITMIAKRYYRLLRSDQKGGDIAELDRYEEARRYLSTLIPEKIETRTGFEFDSLSYMIRHTQKKPRQFIFMANVIATLARQKGFDDDKLFVDQEVVREGVHARLDSLVGGAFDIYETVYYNRADLITRAGLTGARSYFAASDLDRLLTNTNSIKGPELDKQAVKRLLLEVGVLGVARTANDTSIGTTFLEAEYEYQVKDVLTITQETLCVVHPMFYEELRIHVDTTVFTYPKPYEGEEALIIDGIGVKRTWR